MCTCNIHTANESVTLNARAREGYDPTRTVTLRNQFAREMRSRINKVTSIIRRAIVDQDVFGMQMTTQALPNPGEFDFERNSRKVGAFMDWLNQQVAADVLDVAHLNQIGDSVDNAWTNKYISDSYKRGVQRANVELRAAGYDVQTIVERGGIDAVMGTPFSVDRVGVLYTRAFQDLKGITDQMSTQISRVLSQGMIDGDNPRLLARKLNAVIAGPVGDLAITDTLGRFIPAKRRAEMLARTEVIRAHHLGMIQEYENWRTKGVYVRAEWSTAGDDRVCPDCADLEGSVYNIEEARGMIPKHPQCRCIALPITEETKRR